MSERLIYMNGKFVPKSQATVSVFDHGFLYGDGIFEGIRSYSGNVFRLRQHLVRLYESAKSILLNMPLSIEEMEKAVVETVRRNELQDSYIRLIISRGVGDLGLDPRSCPTANVIIIADQIKLFPDQFYEEGLKIVSVASRRNIPDALNPKIKSLNYLNNILVKMEASQAGAMEALVLNQDGFVCEGSGDNIFIIKNKKILTPPSYLGALEGVTRNAILELCEKLEFEAREEPFTRHDVYTADECFLTGTAAEVIPVVAVDNREIGDGKPGCITQQLIAEFRALTLWDGTQVYEIENITANDLVG